MATETSHLPPAAASSSLPMSKSDDMEPHSEAQSTQRASSDYSPPVKTEADSIVDGDREPTDNAQLEKQEPVAANATSTPNPAPSPPPNGGTQAWLQVLSGFSLFFNTWGLLNTFGIYQTYYESGALFTQTSSNIAWIGSIQAYCVLLVGAFSGPIYDRGYLRVLLIIGSFGIVFGHMMLSLCHEYWQVILAQGFCIGIGAGCLFVPAVAILPTYFSTRLGLAVGLAASGSSMGGIIYPIVFYRLIDKIGYGWTVRVCGFIALATLFIPIFLMKMRVKPARARALIDWSAFTDVPYMVFTVATLIGFIGLYVVTFYISYFGQSQGITDTSLSFYLVPILNAGSVFGRTIPNAMADKLGVFNMILPGALVMSILIFCLIAVKSVAGIVIVTLLFGFFSGVFIALPPVCFVMLTKDKSKIGTRIGMGFGIVGFSVLASAPGGGNILGTNAADLDWTGLWVYGGVASAVAGLLYLGLRMYLAKGKLVVKV